MKKDFELALSSDEINKKIKNYVLKNRDFFYKEKNNIYFLIVLKGALNFFTSFYNELSVDINYGFCKISSYDYTQKKYFSDINILCSNLEIKNKIVVIVEDIIDTGGTIAELCNILNNKYSPKEIRVLTLIKRSEKILINKDFTAIQLDYLFLLNNKRWIIGYGMDVDNFYRYMQNIYYYN